MYSIWIRIDDTLPWIELKGEYATRREAKQAVQQVMKKIAVMFVNIPQERRPINALATVRTRR